ncbi:MAG: GNAT family N-acetyltransferase [Candidatus Dormibacteria bacterium]
MEWPADIEAAIPTARLTLIPQRREHAAEMLGALSDPALYFFTGGEPPSSREWLEDRFSRLETRRSGDGSDLWLNWVIQLSPAGPLIGYVQASVTSATAELAWVIGTPWQRHGYGTEAVAAMMAWLRVRLPSIPITAAIHPDHVASGSLARKVGLRPTERMVDGEVLWSDPSLPLEAQ